MPILDFHATWVAEAKAVESIGASALEVREREAQPPTRASGTHGA